MPYIVKSSLDIGGKIVPWNEQEINRLIKEKEEKVYKKEIKKETKKSDELKADEEMKKESKKETKKSQKVGEK